MAVNRLIAFPYDVTEDRVRFQKSVIDGEMGVYDTVEKRFIPQDVLESLIENLVPESNYHIKSQNDKRIVQSINRIRRNLSLYHRNPSESYAQIFLKYLSNRFLSSWPEYNINTAVLYADVVGSTKLATRLSSEELSSLIRIFSQEMSIMVSKHGGFVLKYAGDAVITYFPRLDDLGNMTENAVRCGYSMNMVVNHAINVAVQDFALPQIQIRVSIDFGKHQIVFLGAEPDLIGHTITIASKMIPHAKPGQIVLGDGAYRELSNQVAAEFTRDRNDVTGWNYTNPETGQIYPIYFSKIGDKENASS